MNKFQDLNLSAELLRALEKMKIKSPTEIQSLAIPQILSGKDLIGIAQTGSGKTLAFTLAVVTQLQKKPSARALVLAPSREMAQQIYSVIRDLCEPISISSSLAIGGIPNAKQISQLKKNPRIIVATPGRMNDHLVTNKLLLQNVEFVIIDEADRMLDLGFAPQLKNIKKTLRTGHQTLLFSASFNSEVEIISHALMNKNVLIIKTLQAEKPVSDLVQKVLLLDRKNKDDRLVYELNRASGAVIVFTGSQDSCERLGLFLKNYGDGSDFIHGGLTQGHRNRVIREFRESKIRILVTTDLLARGLDVPHVENIINFDLPFLAEDFLHRIGRTARAGRTGTAITFVTASDAKMYQEVKSFLEGAEVTSVSPDFKLSSLEAKSFLKKEPKRTDKYKDKSANKN